MENKNDDIKETNEEDYSQMLTEEVVTTETKNRKKRSVICNNNIPKGYRQINLGGQIICVPKSK